MKSPTPSVRIITETTAIALLDYAMARFDFLLALQNIRDPLTGLFNRRYMEETLHRDLERAKRSGNSLTIAMIDVDLFKRFNDSFGRAAGDVVLREMAQLMKSKMRQRRGLPLRRRGVRDHLAGDDARGGAPENGSSAGRAEEALDPLPRAAPGHADHFHRPVRLSDP